MKLTAPPAILWISTLLTALTAVWLFGTRWTLNAAEWPTKPNPAAWPAGAWLLPIGVLLIFGGLAAWSAWDRFRRAKSRREKNASTATSVVALSLVALLWPWSLLGPTPGGGNGVTNLVAATWSDVANGYFSAAYRVDDVRQFSREYADKWQTSASPQQAHVATHPPGTVLFYYGARRLYESLPPLQSAFTGIATSLTHAPVSEVAEACRLVVKASTGVASTLPDSAVGCALWCCFLLSLATSLTIPAVYLMGAGDGRHEARGLLAAAFYALAPMVGLFTFGVDAAIACGAAWVLVLCGRRLAGASPLWIAAAGIVLGLTSFLSFGAMAAGVIVVVALLLHAGSRSISLEGLKGPLRDIAFFAAGFLALWLLLCLIFPMQPLRIYQQAMAQHHAAALAPRTYLHWAWMNIVMFALFAGWPVILASLAGLRARGSEAPGRAGSTLLIGRAAWLAILVLTLSGKVRGEVERLWMFLLPAVCALAAYALLAPAEGNGAPVANFGEGAAPPRGAASEGTPSEGTPSEGTPATPEASGFRSRAVALPAAMLLLVSAQCLMMVAALAPLVRP